MKISLDFILCGGIMVEKQNHTLLKIEGFVFALGVVFFLIMFYFNYISKYFLGVSILFFSAVLFSINATLQQQKNVPVSKLNIFLSFLLFAAGLGLGIYFYSTGLIAF